MSQTSEPSVTLSSESEATIITTTSEPSVTLSSESEDGIEVIEMDIPMPEMPAETQMTDSERINKISEEVEALKNECRNAINSMKTMNQRLNNVFKQVNQNK